jgi:hypothetical protein
LLAGCTDDAGVPLDCCESDPPSPSHGRRPPRTRPHHREATNQVFLHGPLEQVRRRVAAEGFCVQQLTSTTQPLEARPAGRSSGRRRKARMYWIDRWLAGFKLKSAAPAARLRPGSGWQRPPPAAATACCRATVHGTYADVLPRRQPYQCRGRAHHRRVAPLPPRTIDRRLRRRQQRQQQPGAHRRAGATRSAIWRR